MEREGLVSLLACDPYFAAEMDRTSNKLTAKDFQISPEAVARMKARGWTFRGKGLPAHIIEWLPPHA